MFQRLRVRTPQTQEAAKGGQSRTLPGSEKMLSGCTTECSHLMARFLIYVYKLAYRLDPETSKGHRVINKIVLS